MDRSSLAPPTTPGITTEDVDRLLEAAQAALRWFDNLDRHAPKSLTFGGEAKVRRQLREAVRLTSFEVRACTACGEGRTYAPTTHPMERPRMVACPECGGTGKVRVFVYERPKARRGR